MNVLSGSKLTSQVELHLSCIGLPNLDSLSKSDPFVVIYLKGDKGGSTGVGDAQSNHGQQGWYEIKRTSTVWDSLNPEWADQVLLEYHFELVQELRFDIYDRDSQSNELSTHDFLGTVRTTLSKIMGSRGATFSAYLENTKRSPQKSGKLIIRGEEVSTCKDIIRFQLEGHKLERKNWFGLGRSDPFFTVSRSREDGSFVKVWESEALRGTLNPIWKMVVVPAQTLCNGDYDRTIRIDVYDWESSGDHKLIGGFTTSVRALQSSKEFSLINDEHKKKKGEKYSSSGSIMVKSIQVETRYSFLDYIRGGCQLNLIVAIDFTASNGAPTSPQSLHYQHPTLNLDGSLRNVVQLNEYQRAIVSIGQILQDYDSDSLFPLYGFGGAINGETNHCFPLTFDPYHPEVHGVQGILEAYKSAFNYVSLSGPTLFHRVLNMANSHASQHCSQENQSYTILLILTDGVINDMDQTIEQIVEGSGLPLSIVIVGVGSADFGNMEVLDADDAPLSYNGKKTKRDIVQFVPFRKFYNMHYAALAAETLAEIPEQLVSYMQTMNIRPNPPTLASNRHLQVEQSQRLLNTGPGAQVAPRVVQAGPGSYAPVLASAAPPAAPEGQPYLHNVGRGHQL